MAKSDDPSVEAVKKILDKFKNPRGLMYTNNLTCVNCGVDFTAISYSERCGKCRVMPSHGEPTPKSQKYKARPENNV